MPRIQNVQDVNLRDLAALKQYPTVKGKDNFIVDVFELRVFTSVRFTPPKDVQFALQEARVGGNQGCWSLFIGGVQVILLDGLEPSESNGPVVGRLSVRLRRLTNVTNDQAEPRYYWYAFMTPLVNPDFPPSHKIEIVEEPQLGNDPAFGPKQGQARANRKQVERLYWLCLRPLG